MLMDLKDKVQVERGEGWQEPCEEMLRELARYELSGAQMHQAMERVQWCGGGVTADRLLLAARFVAELGKTGEVLF